MIFLNFRSTGDAVIQNGANSAVGKNVIQLAKNWGFKTVNVIRKREDEEKQKMLEQELIQLGADHVITDEDLRNAERMNAIWKSGLSKPRLFLNCVGGKNATDCLRHLQAKGTMVTYGGMSRQPVIIPTGSLIFLDHHVHGFWMTKWYQEQPLCEQNRMLDSVASALMDGSLKVTTPITFTIDQFAEAIRTSMQGNVKGKVTLMN